MLKTIVPLALVAALGFGSTATALTDTGTIASLNTVNDTVTLTDGSTFAFDDEDYADRLSSFKPGDQVAISWHHVGTSMEASAISPVDANQVGDSVAKAGALSPVSVTYSADQASGYPDHGIDHLD